MKNVVLLATGIVIIAVVTVINASAESGSDYWPGWRGPDGSGVAPKGNPPLTWSESENVKWKVKLPGEGTSSPIIWGDRIFFLTAIKTDEKGSSSAKPAPAASLGRRGRGGGRAFHGGRAPTNVYKFDIVCMDRKTGGILWQKTVRQEVPHEGHHPDHGFASYSPVTDGKYVWASFGSQGVHCYDIEGNHKWSRDLGKLTIKVMFGEGGSPVLAGDVNQAFDVTQAKPCLNGNLLTNGRDGDLPVGAVHESRAENRFQLLQSLAEC